MALLSYATLWNKRCIIPENDSTWGTLWDLLVQKTKYSELRGSGEAHSEKVSIHLFTTFWFLCHSPHPKLALECSRPQSHFSVWALTFKSPDSLPALCPLSGSGTQSLNPCLNYSVWWGPGLKGATSASDFWGRQDRTLPGKAVLANCCINHCFCQRVSVRSNATHQAVLGCANMTKSS